MKKSNFFIITGVLLLLAGFWTVLAPFSRPLPGGEVFSFESTPEASCRSPLIGAFIEDTPIFEVYENPRPKVGDPTVKTSVECSSRALFRLAVGFILLISGITFLVVFSRMRRNHE